MKSVAHPVTDYLQRYREGHRDEAFFGLLETDPDILPFLMSAFRAESDGRVRAFLVEVIWQHRKQSVIPFLGEALADSESVVWRQALDGLVTLSSPAALEILHSSHRSATGESRGWIAEAIEHAQERMRQV
jgi:hypothetical protein